MMNMRTGYILLLLLAFQLTALTPLRYAHGAAREEVPDKARCPVCGMFVAKYPNWLARIHHENSGQIQFFDGVKDMMVYYYTPERYGGTPQGTISDMYVKDYYTLGWLPAKEAFYVIGSDIYGPMGHELIPFVSREAAAAFSKDHHGRKILTFEEITPALIDSLRKDQKMR